MNMTMLEIVGSIQAAIIGSTQIIGLLVVLLLILLFTSRSLMKKRKE